METHRKSMKATLLTIVILVQCAFYHEAHAQKSTLTSNWIKINNGQYGFVVGSNKKDSIYFVTITQTRVAREDRNIAIILPDGEAKGKANFIDEFSFLKRNVVLYLYVGQLAKKVSDSYYDDLAEDSALKCLLMAEGLAGASAEFKTRPYIQSAHRAVYQETESLKTGVYFFNKTGVPLKPGMPLLNESGKSVVAIVADDLGSKQERFSVISIRAIAEQLNQIDRNRCRYFNLLKVGESLTPCEKEAIRKKEEELNRIKEEIERKNRTRAEQRLVRRNSDYLFSFGPAASFTSQQLKNKGTGETIIGSGWTFGMNLHINPNPDAKLPLAIRPRYSFASFKMPENTRFGSANQLRLHELSIEAFEVPIVAETGAAGIFFALGYVPVYVHKMKFSYTTNSDNSPRRDEITDRAQYLHRIHFETGIQYGPVRITLLYQYQLGSFMNRQYEMVVGSEFLQPFEDLNHRYSTIGLELSARLWGRWRYESPKS